MPGRRARGATLTGETPLPCAPGFPASGWGLHLPAAWGCSCVAPQDEPAWRNQRAAYTYHHPGEELERTWVVLSQGMPEMHTKYPRIRPCASRTRAGAEPAVLHPSVPASCVPTRAVISWSQPGPGHHRGGNPAAMTPAWSRNMGRGPDEGLLWGRGHPRPCSPAVRRLVLGETGGWRGGDTSENRGS